MKRIIPVFLALITAVILKLFVFDFIISQGHSMEPVITDRSVVFISRIRYGVRLPFFHNRQYLIQWSLPSAGEIIVFFTPEGKPAVKRCISIDGQYFFAEGDNSLVSYDSRAYGPVHVDNIIGKVLGY
jgi:signal peptidase I